MFYNLSFKILIQLSCIILCYLLIYYSWSVDNRYKSTSISRRYEYKYWNSYSLWYAFRCNVFSCGRYENMYCCSLPGLYQLSSLEIDTMMSWSCRALIWICNKLDSSIYYKFKSIFWSLMNIHGYPFFSKLHIL